MVYHFKLDSVRAIAVLMVVVSHWIPKSTTYVPFGFLGVDIFFVISGFLITGIILTEKEKIETTEIKPRIVLINFIIRRALRIFPIYYLTLFFYWLLLDGKELIFFKEKIAYFLFYGTNVLIYTSHDWLGYLSPLWSLAVEEQFYLGWPVILLFFQKRTELFIISTFFTIGLFFSSLKLNDMAMVLTPACLSSLCMGALLAWIYKNRIHWFERYKKIIAFISLICFLSLILNYFTDSINFAGVINSRVLVSFITVVIIAYCVGLYNQIRIIELIVTWKPLLFIGKISYGVYLYHSLSPILWNKYLIEFYPNSILNLDEALANSFLLIFKFSFLIFFSWLSYNFIERPFLKIKRYFITN